MPSVGFEGALGQQAMAEQIRQRLIDELNKTKTLHGMSVEDQRLALEKQRMEQETADRALLRSQQGAVFNEKIAEGTATNLGAGPTIISPELAKRFQNTTLAPLVKADASLPSAQISAGGTAPSSISSMTGAGAPAGDGTATPPAITQQPPRLTGQLRFMGTPAANAAEQQKVLRGQLLADPSLTPQQRLEMQAESAGLKAPSREPKAPIDPTKTHEANRLFDAAHPLPKDTSTSDANRLDRSYQFNSGQLEKTRTPIALKLDRLAGLNDALTQATPASDALVAPEILSISAGGQGSGLRMNEAEIARIVGGRSVWENLKASLQKLSTDPAHANSLTPDQRTQIRQIADAVQGRARRKLEAIRKAEQGLVDAEDVQGHRQVLRTLQGQLDAIDGGGATGGSTAEDLIKKYGG